MSSNALEPNSDGRSTAITRMAVLLAICLGASVLFRWFHAHPVAKKLQQRSSVLLSESSLMPEMAAPSISIGDSGFFGSGSTPDDDTAPDWKHAHNDSEWKSDSWIPFEEEGFWGYREGDLIVISPRFDEAKPFSQGLAVVKVTDKFGYIDEKGNFLIPPELEAADPFKGGTAIVATDGVFQIIDNTGRLVSNDTFDSAWDVEGDVYLVKVDGKYGYVDKQGRYFFPPIAEETFGFTEGLSAVKIDGLYGFIDINGRITIPPKYDYAWPFENNEALVKIEGRHWFIDHDGKLLREY